MTFWIHFLLESKTNRLPSGSKSDTADALRRSRALLFAELLADYLREHLSHLRAWSIDEPSLRQLKLLREVRYRYTGRVEDRDKVVQQKVRLQNQLRQTLIEYFPQAVEAFSDLTTQTANESITLSF